MPDQRALADLLRLGSAQREDALLQAEMQRAADLARPRGRVYGTPGGAVMGGLAQGIRGMVGGFSADAAQKKAEEAERGRADAKQQWITADAQKRAAARAALLRGQTPPADGMPMEPSPQEQAAGMAAALRRQAVEQDLAKSAPGGGTAGMGGSAPAPDALTQFAPYQAGPLLGVGAAPSGAPAAPLAPIAGQGGGSAAIGNPLRALISGPINTPIPAGQMLSPAMAQPKMSAQAVAPPPPASDELPDLTPEQYAEIAIASGDPAMMAWGKTVLEQANLRANLDAKQKALDAAAKAKADAGAEKQKGDATKLAQDLRKEFMAIPAVKNAIDLRVALDKLQRGAAADSAAGDMSMVFSYMKMQDPTSSVREGEYATAQNAAGVPEMVRNVYNKAVDGRFLSPKQRSDFVQQAKQLYIAQAAPAIKLYGEFGKYVTAAGFDPAEVLPDLGFAQPPAAPKAKPGAFVGPGGKRAVLQPDGTYEVE